MTFRQAEPMTNDTADGFDGFDGFDKLTASKLTASRRQMTFTNRPNRQTLRLRSGQAGLTGKPFDFAQDKPA